MSQLFGEGQPRNVSNYIYVYKRTCVCRVIVLFCLATFSMLLPLWFAKVPQYQGSGTTTAW